MLYFVLRDGFASLLAASSEGLVCSPLVKLRLFVIDGRDGPLTRIYLISIASAVCSSLKTLRINRIF